MLNAPKVQTCHIRWQKCFYCSFFQGLASIFGGQEKGGHSTQLFFKCWVIPFFYLNQKNFKRYCEKLEKQRKNKTSTLYCAGKSSLHGPEIWIFPGFEVASNFSALKTLLPNKQYLEKKTWEIIAIRWNTKLNFQYKAFNRALLPFCILSIEINPYAVCNWISILYYFLDVYRQQKSTLIKGAFQ